MFHSNDTLWGKYHTISNFSYCLHFHHILHWGDSYILVKYLHVLKICDRYCKGLVWWNIMQLKVKYKYKIWYIFLCCSLWTQYNPCHQSNNAIWYTQQLRHNQRDGVSNHQRIDCLPKRLFRRRSKKTSKFCVIYFARGIHRWSMHKGPVTRKMFPFDNVIMLFVYLNSSRLIMVTSIYSKSQEIRTLFFAVPSVLVAWVQLI